MYRRVLLPAACARVPRRFRATGSLSFAVSSAPSSSATGSAFGSRLISISPRTCANSRPPRVGKPREILLEIAARAAYITRWKANGRCRQASVGAPRRRLAAALQYRGVRSRRAPCCACGSPTAVRRGPMAPKAVALRVLRPRRCRTMSRPGRSASRCACPRTPRSIRGTLAPAYTDMIGRVPVPGSWRAPARRGPRPLAQSERRRRLHRAGLDVRAVRGDAELPDDDRCRSGVVRHGSRRPADQSARGHDGRARGGVRLRLSRARGFGAFAEAGVDTFFGTGSTLDPLLSIEGGVFLDFEVLP